MFMLNRTCGCICVYIFICPVYMHACACMCKRGVETLFLPMSCSAENCVFLAACLSLSSSCKITSTLFVFYCVAYV